MSPEPNNQSRLTTIVVIAVIALILGIVVWQSVITKPGKLPEQLAATVLPQGKPITGLSLKDHDGELFTEQRFKGKWSFLFFGFTNCPDICPTTMLVMKAVWAKLPDAAKRAPEPQLYFVSVDPQRDTLDKLKAYATFYHPDFVGITGNLNQIDVLTNQLGVLYGYEDDETTDDGYTVNHSAQIVLIDPDGKMRAVFSTPHNVREMAKTFVAIRNYFGE